MIHNKQILTGLDHSQYEHPLDRAALEKLESIPFLTTTCKWVTSNFIERVYNIQYTGSNLKVTKDNYPKIYEYLVEACRILDLQQVPELYITWGYDINACTIGAENPIIVLNSGLIDLCDDDEILFIIGHEVGHIKSQHMLYHLMAQVINWGIDTIPGGSLVASGLQFALYYWSRMSEFTADRIGLLCRQDINVALSTMIKKAGLPRKYYDQINIDGFIQQARDFNENYTGTLNVIVKNLTIRSAEFPWLVDRAAKLLDWYEHGNYNQIVNS